MTNTFATETGRCYELFVKAGALRAMIDFEDGFSGPDKDRIRKAFARFLRVRETLLAELDLYRIDEMVPRVLQQISPPSDVQAATSRYLEGLGKQAMLSGYSVVREYLSRLNGAGREGRGGIEELLYLQCSVSGEFGTDETYLDRAVPDLAELFGRPFHPLPYLDAGEFLKGDFIACFRTGDGISILVLEMSCAAPGDFAEMPDMSVPAELVGMLGWDIGHMARKAVFTPATFEAGDLGFELSEGIAEHFKAFSSSDKEPSKLIQGCSYAESFLHMLESMDGGSTATLGEGWRENWEANIVAITNRAPESVNVVPQTRALLRAAHRVYPELRRNVPGVDLPMRRRRLTEALVRLSRESFDDPAVDFEIEDLIAASPERPLIITEMIEDLRNPSGPVTREELVRWLGPVADHVAAPKDLRDAHTQMILYALGREEMLLVLAGHPGIGKTYSIRQYLKEEPEGYLFFYFSPRIIVNEGLIGEFSDELEGSGVALINTDSHVIRTSLDWLPAAPTRSVILRGISNEGLPRGPDVAFLTFEEYDGMARAGAQQRAEQTRSPVTMQSQTTMGPARHRPGGVLNSLTYAARSLIESGHNRIVAAASIQAVRISDHGRRTTDAFQQNLFRNGLVKGKPTLDALRELASRCPTVVIAIDEITGDSAGAELYAEMRKLLVDTFRRPFEDAGETCPFKLKLIVADASLNNPGVALKYLKDREPSADRIYVDEVGPGAAEDFMPLSFSTPARDTVFINANAFPSNDPLTIRYHVMLNRVPEDADRQDQYAMLERATAHIKEITRGYLQRPGHEQTIVYIQDKRRIGKLDEELSREMPESDILLCHANLSRQERQDIETSKNTAPLVLMTSSGARGISFGKSDTIILEVPGFALEQNMMEIIQAIYRGRGPGAPDLKPRILDFVIARNVFVAEGDAEEDLHPQALAISNLMLILRTSVHTRLRGFGRVGSRRISMIPVGGKNVESSAQSFSRHISELTQNLRKAIDVSGRDRDMRGACITLARDLPGIFADADYRIGDPDAGVLDGLLSDRMKLEFAANFNELIKKGLGGLVLMSPFPKRAFAFGQVLVEPIQGSEIRETIRFQTWQDSFTENVHRLRATLEGLDRSRIASNLRGSIDAVEGWLRRLRSSPHETEFTDTIASGMRFIATPVPGYDRPGELASFIPDEGEEHLRDVLIRYLRNHAQVNDVIPRISPDAYRGASPFPFLCFANPYLRNIATGLFSRRHVAATPEFNLMNLLTLSDPALVQDLLEGQGPAPAMLERYPEATSQEEPVSGTLNLPA